MKSTTRLVLSGLALAVLAACAGELGLPGAVNTASAGSGAVSGQVTLPVSALDKGNVIPTGIGAVIAAGGGNVIPTGQGSYRVLDVASADPELPVSGAQIAGLDPASHARLAGVQSVKTDGTGHFLLSGAAPGSVVLVEAAFLSPDNRQGFRLLNLARAGGADSAPVSYASTLVVEALLKQAALHPGSIDWSKFDPASLTAAEAAVRQELEALPAAQRLAVLTTALGVDPKTLLAGGDLPDTLLGPNPTLPSLPALSASGTVLPSIIASTAPAALASAVSGTLGSAPGTLASTTSGTLASPLASTVPAALASTVSSVASTVPGALASTVSVTSTQTNNTVASIAPSPLASTLSQVTNTLPTATPVTLPTATPLLTL